MSLSHNCLMIIAFVALILFVVMIGKSGTRGGGYTAPKKVSWRGRPVTIKRIWDDNPHGPLFQIVDYRAEGLGQIAQPFWVPQNEVHEIQYPMQPPARTPAVDVGRHRSIPRPPSPAVDYDSDDDRIWRADWSMPRPPSPHRGRPDAVEDNW